MTLTTVLEYPRHSFIKKPCTKQFKHDYVSGRNKVTYTGDTTTYVQTPNFHLMGEQPKYSNFHFYFATLRDPFAKILSAFTYSHPRNGFQGVKYKLLKIRRNCGKMYECFTSLKQFAFWVGENKFNFEYPFSPETVVQTNCTNLARVIMASRVSEGCNENFFHNTKTILERIPGWDNT